MVQLRNFFVSLLPWSCPWHGSTVLLKWFVKRDVPTGASSSNGTIIPIPIPLFPFCGVLVKASRPIILQDKMEIISYARNDLFGFVPVHQIIISEYMGDLSYIEYFCGLICLQFFRTLFSLPRDRSEACPAPHIERRVKVLGSEAFPPLVEWCLFGGVPPVRLYVGCSSSCDPMAYVRPVAHASYSICSERAA
ncbi:hypothetical protein ZWY2020_015048 [Hordeum vulgare]|nr:hypothetical protein ZWY2020_015048 [Hordeum vulgare]